MYGISNHHRGSAAVSLQTSPSGTVSQAATPFGTQTRQVRVLSNLATWIEIGESGITATAQSDTFLPANTVDYFQVTPEQILAFLSSSTSSGWFSLTPL
jgi:hypothetical protein